MREHSLHICKVLGVGRARLPRQASGTAAAARGGGRGRAQQQGQGRATAALAARSAARRSVAESQAHVTKFGLSRDPGFFPFFQLEFTPMLRRLCN